jgi:hypothetical protein
LNSIKTKDRRLIHRSKRGRVICANGVSLGARIDPAKRRRLPPTAERFDPIPTGEHLSRAGGDCSTADQCKDILALDWQEELSQMF